MMPLPAVLTKEGRREERREGGREGGRRVGFRREVLY